MPNIKKNNQKRVFSICMSKTVVNLIDKIAEKANASRSEIIESVMRGWINAVINDSIEEKKKGEQNESSN